MRMKLAFVALAALLPAAAEVLVYDPARDADKDIRNAVEEAGKAGKRILLEVGGNWCSWCHTLDKFFEEHASLVELRKKNFVLVKVNWSPENENREVLSRYPRIHDYPYLLILEKDGKCLTADDLSDLEDGESYNLKKFTDFLIEWSAGSRKH